MPNLREHSMPRYPDVRSVSSLRGELSSGALDIVRRKSSGIGTMQVESPKQCDSSAAQLHSALLLLQWRVFDEHFRERGLPTLECAFRAPRMLECKKDFVNLDSIRLAPRLVKTHRAMKTVLDRKRRLRTAICRANIKLEQSASS